MRASSAKKTRDSRQLELPVDDRKPEVDGAAAERATEIVESLPSLSGEEVFAAFEELDQLPAAVVKEALSPSTGPAPDPEQLDDTTRRAHGFPPRPLRLRTIALVKDADIFDLGDVAEEQLRIAGRAWDGLDLPAEDRLDGENEGTFAGTLEHLVLADAEAPGIRPMFDVLRYADDAGSIFRAGTTELVGAIAYGVVEMKDRRARAAIQEALAVPFDAGPAMSEEAWESEEAAFDNAPTIAIRGLPLHLPVPARKAKVEVAAEVREATPPAAAAAKKKAASPKKAEAAKKVVTAAAKKEAPAPKKAATAAAKKTAKKEASKKAPAPKKAGAKKDVAPKKAVTKRAPASKKEAAKKTAAPKKATSKKAATTKGAKRR